MGVKLVLKEIFDNEIIDQYINQDSSKNMINDLRKEYQDTFYSINRKDRKRNKKLQKLNKKINDFQEHNPLKDLKTMLKELSNSHVSLRSLDKYKVNDFLSLYNMQKEEPFKLYFQGEEEYFIYRGDLYFLKSPKEYTLTEKELLIKQHYYKREKKFQRLKKEIKLYEKLESSDQLLREPIPEEVRFTVWRRDGGKCVKCGSKEKLEFDHIIPIAKGGSNTERNIQLLCESCNRAKSDKI